LSWKEPETADEDSEMKGVFMKTPQEKALRHHGGGSVRMSLPSGSEGSSIAPFPRITRTYPGSPPEAGGNEN
jgi:hypothetical protein